MRRRTAGASLLGLAAFVAVFCVAMALMPIEANFQATLQLKSWTFIFQENLDEARPLLTGQEVRDLRVLEFESITTVGERVSTSKGPVAVGQPQWAPLAGKPTHVIRPRTAGAQAQFDEIRLNQLSLQPGTRVSVSATDRSELSLVFSEQPVALSLTFGRESTLECQQCTIADRAEHVLSIRVESTSNRTIFVQGGSTPLSLTASFPESEVFKGRVSFSEPTFAVNGGRITIPDLRESAIELGSGTELMLTPSETATNHYRLTSMSVGASGVTITIEGTAAGVNISGRAIPLTAFARLSRFTYLMLLVSIVALAAGGVFALATGQASSPRVVDAVPPGTAESYRPDIFLSYAREDRPTAERVAAALQARGWHVWWDRRLLPGDRFGEVIDRLVQNAKCVVVLWSKAAVSSSWVPAEANEGATRGVLVPIMIERGVAPPLPFRGLHTADLVDWTGDPSDPNFADLATAVEGILRRFNGPVPEDAVAAKTAPPS